MQSVAEQIEREAAREDEHRGATPDPPPQPAESQARHASSPMDFWRRLGTGSPYQTFASLRGRNKPRSATDSPQEGEAVWSGDSSSDDDDLSIVSRRQRHPSAFDLRTDFERRYSQVVEEDDD